MPKGATSPRATASRQRRMRNTPATDRIDTIEKEVSTVTTALEEDTDIVRDLPFEVSITPAPEDYRPDRSPAGRKRIPSPFEPLLPDLKGKGWQNQPHDKLVVVSESGKVELPGGVADSNARVILRELSKAVKFLNSPDGGELNLGLDVNVTATDVQFNIRDKQKRDKKNDDGYAPGGGEITDGETDDYDDDSGDE